ncbi:tRNA dihydrouridine synthase DusB [Parvularcula sp. LCG005]|uniref:tRNA dihydrouridine synthase DusB n=1 Tax=Parvularcula sp. LCG005 TaxID=3078805 RepID=UPI00294334C4|nr:tRNA dihydrouridine synthase DusB [Parvularcula sp. LCG005]WOI54073.1 tRNA dihydrouridine synthase DusB [Parvularcula sp. LCG005]
MSLTIGSHTLQNCVMLAPMSGISDLPFRRACAAAGAGLVVSEMVASEDLARERPDTVLRAALDNYDGPKVVQLAGREARWMGEGARLVEAMGADIIDINMGCPARRVTGQLSGSALMRDLDHALGLIEAVIANASVPVTLKMRLGWDHDSLNAPELAQRAEAAGVRLVTVHGRTRQQFYTGQADWAAIAPVKQAVRIPVIANGDIYDVASARAALAASGADGVMIGRAAEGRPWLPGAIGEALKTGGEMIVPDAQAQAAAVIALHRDTVEHYETRHQLSAAAGRALGLKTARKHLAAFADHCPVPLSDEERRAYRGALCRSSSPTEIEALLQRLAAGTPLPEGRVAA